MGSERREIDQPQPGRKYRFEGCAGDAKREWYIQEPLGMVDRWSTRKADGRRTGRTILYGHRVGLTPAGLMIVGRDTR